MTMQPAPDKPEAEDWIIPEVIVNRTGQLISLMAKTLLAVKQEHLPVDKEFIITVSADVLDSLSLFNPKPKREACKQLENWLEFGSPAKKEEPHD